MSQVPEVPVPEVHPDRQVRHFVERRSDQVPEVNDQLRALLHPLRHFSHFVEEVTVGTGPVDNSAGM